jgi:hypothetical protein
MPFLGIERTGQGSGAALQCGHQNGPARHLPDAFPGLPDAFFGLSATPIWTLAARAGRPLAAVSKQRGQRRGDAHRSATAGLSTPVEI